MVEVKNIGKMMKFIMFVKFLSWWIVDEMNSFIVFSISFDRNSVGSSVR